MIKTNRLPTILYIFGGSGDLTQRKLIPALYNLYIDNYLPDQFKIIGVGRHDLTLTEYKAFLKKGAQEHSRRKADEKTGWSKFVQHVDYANYDLTAGKSYTAIKAGIKNCEEEWSTEAQVIFYMSVAPQLALLLRKSYTMHNYVQTSNAAAWYLKNLFGHDLASATELNAVLCRMFKEEQIYRIDHYLGKETVQNILALRFANILFEPIWNNHYIDHVQITAAESIGVGSRGGYYEGSGALRDMVQNHILQLLCMIAMEPPISFDADEIRNKKVDVLNGIRKIRKEDVHLYAVRGAIRTRLGQGEKVKGYRDEQGVKQSSSVETFAAAKFYVDNWRWKDVPFYVRTGKYLTEKETLITIYFKDAPAFSFPLESEETWRANKITISIQPEMDIRLRFQSKVPGPHMQLQPVDMIFSYASDKEQPEAYETLLEDIIEGNATLFMRADQVEAAWQIIAPIMEVWQAKPAVDFPNYTPGSWGPEDAEALIARDGHHWIILPTEGAKSKR